MSDIDNGGPAFPCETVGQDELGEYRLPCQGMTLRDYFAAKVLPACYAESSGRASDWKMCVALEAYEIADAMLKASKK